MAGDEDATESEVSNQPKSLDGCTVRLKFNEERKKLQAQVIRCQEVKPFTEKTLLKLIKKSPYSHLYHLKDNFEQVINAVDSQSEKIIDIAEIRDSVAKVELSDDSMYAFLTITRCYGGKRVVEEEIKQLMQEKNIIHGIFPHKIAEALAADEAEGFIIAEGKEPEHGQDSTFDCLIKDCFFKGPKIDENGRVDFFELQEFVLIEENTPLMRRSPPTAGVAGYDVHHQPIPAKPGLEIPFRDYEGSKISLEDENVLIAANNGHPVVYTDGVKIDPILRLLRVDLTTGNVKFDGSVYIKGDIADNMTVKVTGDVVVDGVIQKAFVKAGGDICVKNGVIGGAVTGSQENLDQIYAAHLEAVGDIQARFIDNARIDAGHVVIVREYIRNSYTTAGEKVLLGRQGGKGQLIGGRTTATKAVEAKLMGTTAEIVTHVEVGIAPKLRAKYDKLSSRIYHKIHSMTGYIGTFGYLKKRVDDPLPGDEASDMEKSELLKTAQTIRNILFELEELSTERDKLESLMKEARDAFVKADKNVFRNLTVKIKDTQYKVNDAKSGGTFVLRGRSIDFSGDPKK